MTPISITLVQLPQPVVHTFFPDLVRVASIFYSVDCQLADDSLDPRGVWDVAGMHLISRTMSAHEIVSAISVGPERLPSGLGILAVAASRHLGSGSEVKCRGCNWSILLFKRWSGCWCR